MRSLFLAAMIGLAACAAAQAQVPAAACYDPLLAGRDPATQAAIIAGTRVRQAPLSELIGLDPAGVRAGVAAVPADWPLPINLTLADKGGLLSFVTLTDALQDPAIVAWNRSWAFRGPRAPYPAHTVCDDRVLRKGDEADRTSGVILMFRNGRLAGAFDLPPRPPVAPRPLPKSMAEATARAAEPRFDPFSAQRGDVPLADGAGFLARWTKETVAPTDVIRTTCRPFIPRPPPKGHAPQDTAGLMQGLALVPFAVVQLPLANAGRQEAQRDGPALVDALHVGEPLGEPVSNFAEHHSVVRLHPGFEPGYAVLAIDLGGPPTNNLSDFRDTALVGVRDDRVAWIMPKRGGVLGLGPDTLCEDRRGAPSRARRGCSQYGSYLH